LWDFFVVWWARTERSGKKLANNQSGMDLTARAWKK
jgi:hypothetical protein